MEASNRQRHWIIQELYDWSWALFLFFMFAWLIGHPTIVPSGSMKPTILEGDRVWISKLHYGTRTAGHVHIPLLGSKDKQIPLLGIPSYLPWPAWRTYRLPGFSTPQRGDVIVFHTPEEVELPIGERQLYVKELLGLPSDYFEMRNGIPYINDKPLKVAPYKQQYRYHIVAQKALTESFFRRYGIAASDRIQAASSSPQEDTQDYYLDMTPAVAVQLKQVQEIITVKRMIRDQLAEDPKFHFAERLGGNRDHMPRYQVPYQGMEISVNAATMHVYGLLIMHYEGHAKVDGIEEGKLFINDQACTTYTFQQDYYMPKGRNDGASKDGRAFGPLPEDHLVGKAVRILFSSEEDDPEKAQWMILDFIRALLTGRMRWERTFKHIE